MAPLIPSFVTLDGVDFPLYAHPEHVGLARGLDALEALRYALDDLVNGDEQAKSLDALARDGFQQQGITLTLVDTTLPLSWQGDGPLNWKWLSGRWPDFTNSFHVETSFVVPVLMIPRPVVIELVAILRSLRADVLAGRRQGKIDDTPVPPPPPRPPEVEEYARRLAISAEEAGAYCEEIYAGCR